MKNSASIGCLFFVVLAMQVRAQGVAHLAADSTRVETGNPLVLHLSVPGVNVPDSLDFSPWQGRVGTRNFLSVSGWLRKGNSYTKDLTLIFFDADSLVLPPLMVALPYADSARTNPLTLEVYATPSSNDPNDLAPLKDILREPVWWSDYLPLAVSIAVGVAVVSLLLWWVFRRKNRGARHRSTALEPHERALKKLSVLQQKSLWHSGAVKAHCAELTFILREYLETRYQVPALGSTSEELLFYLNKTDFPGSLQDGLRKILLQADLAKFAKAIPPNEFYPWSLEFAKELVGRTTPQSPEVVLSSNPRNLPTIDTPL
jgi:hypothetical protein